MMVNFLVCQNHVCDNFGCEFCKLFFKQCSDMIWCLYRQSSSMRPPFLLLEGQGGLLSAGDYEAFCEQDSSSAECVACCGVNSCETGLTSQ